MIRRISTKLLLAVLAAVAVPFLGFALFVDEQMGDRLSRDVVLYSLKGLAADLASRVERDVDEYDRSTRIWAADPSCNWAIDEFHDDLAGKFEPDTPETERFAFRYLQSDKFDSIVTAEGDYDLLVLVDAEGRLVASNRLGPSGNALEPDVLADLYARSYGHEVWFEAAKAGQPFKVDQHASDLLPPRDPSPGVHPENFHVGFSAPVLAQGEDETTEGPARVAGALFALVNWRRIQDEIESPVLKDYFQGLVGPEGFPSAYAWIWAADADTILAHDDRSLYGERVSGPRVGLPEMVADARSADWGLYRPYQFKGVAKHAAFKHTKSREEGGFGWIAGVGINDEDIFKAVDELRALLFKATLLVLLVAVLWTMVIARRTTGPILALREHVQRVASGDLSARVAVRSQDELGELARALNQMTAEIAHSREQLIKAEKDAAWREMARQVAHDIKNPLTPIQLSAELLQRAKRDGHPEFDALFDRTIELVLRQVEHLRETASDFHALTGVHNAKLERVEIGPLVGDVLELESAWARALGVKIERSGGGGAVRADPALLRRVVINLVSNALEAMPQGGVLSVRTTTEDAQITLEIEDSGVGIPDDVRPRLFEPYFTTRSTGTGLGLAIARRVVEGLGGSIALEPAPGGHGTLARVRLPRDPEA